MRSMCATATVLGWLCFSTGTAQSARPDAARLELLKTDQEWAAVAAKSKDVELIVSLWTDDAVIYPPRQPAVSGKAAIRKYVADSLQIPGFSVTWKPETAVVSAAGDLGYTMGTNTFTFPDSKGAQVTSHGRYLTVWRKEADGRWRCVVDFWNEAPAPAVVPQK